MIPVDGNGATPMRPAGQEPRGVRRVVREARRWGELRETPYGLRPAVLFSVIAFLQILDTQAFVLAGPELIREFDIDIDTVVNLSRLVGFFGIFAALGVAWYADRHRRVPLFVAGTIVSGVSAMLSARAGSVLSLGVPRVVDDVGGLAAGVPLGSLLADYYPPEARGRVFAMMGTLTRLGAIAALPLAGLSLTYLGVGPSFFLFGLPIAVMGIVAAFVLREPVRGYFERRRWGADEAVAVREAEPQSFGEAWRTVWAVRTLRRLFFAAVVGGAGEVAFGFYGFFLVEKYGLSPLERGMFGLPTAVLTLVGGFLGGGLIDSFSRRDPGRVMTVLSVFSAVAALGLFGFAFGPPIPVLMACSAIFGFGLSLVGPATGAIFSQVIPPNVRTQGLQMVQLAAVPGLLFFVPIALTIRAEYGYTTLFLTGAPFLVVSALIAASAGPFFELDRRNAAAEAIAAEEWRQARESGEAKLLVCRGVDVEYDGVQVLFGVDFDVEEGEIVALLGTNGAGKSTLLRAISGSQEASNGAIVFDGRNITHMPPHEVAARGVVHVPGGRGVFPGLTVRENLVLAGWLREDGEGAAALDEVFELFPVLARRSDEPAWSLSGGEQQMLSLAQAFLAKPRLLMIDELSLGLSPAMVEQMLEVVRAFHARGITIVLVEQSVNVALSLAEKAVFMEKGEVRFSGPTADLLRRPDVLRAVYVKGTGAIAERPSAQARRRRAPHDARFVLEVQDVVKRYGGVTALDGVSFTLREGEVLGLIGPNGSGKTTLFDVVSGFQLPDAGTVRFDGVDITHLGADERARRRLVRRFQDARLYPSLTVRETLLLSLERRHGAKSLLGAVARLPGTTKAERALRKRADDLVAMFGLEAFADKFVRELSTGVRRIVDLACAVAGEPLVLLLDEPSSGVAQAEAEAFVPLLRRIRYETGCSMLLIEHDMPLVSAVADELVALDQGHVLVRGEPATVLEDDRVVESYLGGSEVAIRRSGIGGLA